MTTWKNEGSRFVRKNLGLKWVKGRKLKTRQQQLVQKGESIQGRLGRQMN